MKIKRILNSITLFGLFVSMAISAQTEPSLEGNSENLPVREYTLIVRKENINKTGKEVKGMTLNGSIPGPVLEFTEGEYAVIYVKNEMDVETSIHWHGLLLPNFYDGVPYLTTPPIAPGKTQKYEFALKQSGTYWYHSHTMLQEQRGVYGAFVIKPKKETLEYDHELVLMLSDWTDENPETILRYLKRGTEWYNFRKGTTTPLNRIIKQGALGAQLDFWRQRMEGADIADIYYPAFLINGRQRVEYPEFKPGNRVRLRIINGAASTSFWMTFGGEAPLLVSSDGLNVVPVPKNKTFIGIAETYDYLITIPESGKIEYVVAAQDGSGTATAYFGEGDTLKAEELPRPDKIEMMKQMAKMDMKMGAHALKFRPQKDDSHKMKETYGMQMGNMEKLDTTKGKHYATGHVEKEMSHQEMTSDKMKGSGRMDHGLYSEYNYDYLKSLNKTEYDKNIPVREILLNLTGNMQRYIWSMNGVPLSETDEIKIKGNEVTRVTLNNLTMMHHPMHLHGHFFRVINKNEEYSPLKHTVNVPPMQSVTIEFYNNEYGDWFFHCHILYHMMGGMARVFSYDTPRDGRMAGYPIKKLIHETDQWYTWGMADAASHTGGFNLVSSNIRNQFNASLEYGWNKNLEAEITYERYLHDYLRVFAGANMENNSPDDLSGFNTTVVLGMRYLTPYLFSLDARIDSELRPRISVGRSIILFPRFSVFGYYEYQMDFGWVNDLPNNIDYESETVWNAGAEYMLSRDFSLMASYDNRFGAGGGLSLRF